MYMKRKASATLFAMRATNIDGACTRAAQQQIEYMVDKEYCAATKCIQTIVF